MPRDVAWNPTEDAASDWLAPRGAGREGAAGEPRPFAPVRIRGAATPQDRRPATLLEARFALSGLIVAIEDPGISREALRDMALNLSVALRHLAG